jgi:hypothetical protein
MTWQSIETAPKDGTRVILSWAGKSINGFYLDNRSSSAPWAGWRVESLVPCPAGKPTHWQPFPPPCAASAAPSQDSLQSRPNLACAFDCKWPEKCCKHGNYPHAGDQQ